MEVTNVVECQELKPDEQLFAEGDDSEVRVFAKSEGRTHRSRLIKASCSTETWVVSTNPYVCNENEWNLSLEIDIHEHTCELFDLCTMRVHLLLCAAVLPREFNKDEKVHSVLVLVMNGYSSHRFTYS